MWEKSWPASTLKPKGNVLPSSRGPACSLLLFLWTGSSRSPSAWVLKDWEHFPQPGAQRGQRMQKRTGDGMEPAWWEKGDRKGEGCSVLFPEDIFWDVYICAMIFSKGYAKNLLSRWTQQLRGLSAWCRLSRWHPGLHALLCQPFLMNTQAWGTQSSWWAAMQISRLECQWMRTLRTTWHVSAYSNVHQIWACLSPEGLGSGVLI